MKFDPSRANEVSWLIEIEGAKLEETHPRLMFSNNEINMLFKGRYIMVNEGRKVVFDLPVLDKYFGESVVEGRMEVLVGETQCLPVWNEQVTLERLVRARVGESTVTAKGVAPTVAHSSSPQPTVKPKVSVRSEPVVESKKPKCKSCKKDSDDDICDECKKKHEESPRGHLRDVLVVGQVDVDDMMEFVRKGGSVQEFLERKQ